MSKQIIALASEGVPVAVIARSLSISSSAIYDLLQAAQDADEIIAIPAYDWPQSKGAPKDRAFVAGLRIRAEKVISDPLLVPVRTMFGLTHQQAIIYLALLRGVTGIAPLKTALQSQDHTLKVQICKLRQKLIERGETAALPQTLWGDGYIIAKPVRLAMLERIEAFAVEMTEGDRD